jgi:hypothetical protein
MRNEFVGRCRVVHPHPSNPPSSDFGATGGRGEQMAAVRLSVDISRRGFFGSVRVEGYRVRKTKRKIFWISKIIQFPSETTVFDPAVFFKAPIIPNLYGAIKIFTGFFWADPLPTPDF